MSGVRTPSGSPPTENTLEVNLTHEMLRDLSVSGFSQVVAISPTRINEGKEFGYDTAIEFEKNSSVSKAFIVQWKRPDPTASNGVWFDADESNKSQPYKLDLICGSSSYPPAAPQGNAFYGLPLIYDRGQFPNQIDRVVFVDAYDVHSQLRPSDNLGYFNISPRSSTPANGIQVQFTTASQRKNGGNPTHTTTQTKVWSSILSDFNQCTLGFDFTSDYFEEVFTEYEVLNKRFRGLSVVAAAK